LPKTRKALKSKKKNLINLRNLKLNVNPKQNVNTLIDNSSVNVNLLAAHQLTEETHSSLPTQTRMKLVTEPIKL